MREKEKGFTMVELLAVIVILGVIATIAIAGIRGVLNKTKESYLDNQNKMVVLAGKTYYADHRNKLPKIIGPIHEVDVKTLVDLKYIDPVKDANGKECIIESNDKKSKVMVQKVSKEEYKYTGYLYCSGKSSGTNDKVKPVVTLSPTRTTTASKKAFTVTLKVTDNVAVLSYRYIIYKDGKEYKDTGYKNYQKPIEIKLTENGTYRIKAYAYDTSGNNNNTEGGNYVINIPQPNCNSGVSLTSATTSNKWQNKNVTITLKVTDPSIESWTVKDRHYDNANRSSKVNILSKRTTAKTKSFTLTENGEHTITVDAYNSVGGHCSKTYSAQIYKIDKEKPFNVSISNPTGGNWTNRNFSLTVSAKEQYSGIDRWQYSYDRNNWVNYPKPASSKTTYVTTPFSAERNQNAYIRAIDVAGNISSVSSTRIRIDKTKPSVSFTTGSGPHNSNSGIRVYGRCSDNAGGSGVNRLTGNGAGVGSPTRGTSRTIGCYDNAGNYSSVSRTFRVRYYSRNYACGVELYYYRRSSACGAATCGSCKRTEAYQQQTHCINTNGSNGNCCPPGWKPHVGGYYPGSGNGSSARICTRTAYRTVYYTCTSATYCGWRGCRHSSHGIERYRNCWHY